MKNIISTSIIAVGLAACCVGCAAEQMRNAEAANLTENQAVTRIEGYYDIAEQEELFKIYRSYELTTETLVNRNGKMIIEAVVGRCINEDGDGVVLGKEKEYYINYRGIRGVSENDIVCTYMIYNPDSNYEDDIINRYDYVIDKWTE